MSNVIDMVCLKIACAYNYGGRGGFVFIAGSNLKLAFVVGNYEAPVRYNSAIKVFLHLTLKIQIFTRFVHSGVILGRGTVS